MSWACSAKGEAAGPRWSGPWLGAELLTFSSDAPATYSASAECEKRSLSCRLISSSFTAMKLRSSTCLLLSLVLSQAALTGAAAREPVPPTWERIHAGTAFSFDAPGGTKAVPVPGIDSYVGAYVADGFSIGFDYGPWSNDLQSAATWDSIDGRISKYESGSAQDCAAFPGDKTQGKLETSIYVAQSPKVALNMHGCARDQKGLRDLQRVFRSIRFGPGQ
jgi:hypothetical protein